MLEVTKAAIERLGEMLRQVGVSEKAAVRLAQQGVGSRCTATPNARAIVLCDTMAGPFLSWMAGRRNCYR